MSYVLKSIDHLDKNATEREPATSLAPDRESVCRTELLELELRIATLN